jgi:class 3 adenylate cyclase
MCEAHGALLCLKEDLFMALLKLPRQAEKRNPIVGIIIGLVVASAFGLLYNTWSKDVPGVRAIYDVVKNLEYRAYDRRFLARGRLPKKDVNQDIVLLDYDNDAQQWKPFPPDRTVYPDIIRALGADGAQAKCMFFDIFFFDPFGRRLDVNNLDLFYTRFADLKHSIRADIALMQEEKAGARDAFKAINGIADATTFQKTKASLRKAAEIGSVDAWDAALMVDAKKAVDSKVSLVAPGSAQAAQLKPLATTLGELAYPPIISTIKTVLGQFEGVSEEEREMVFYDFEPGQLLIVKKQLESMTRGEEAPVYVGSAPDAAGALKILNEVFTEDRINNAFNSGGIFQPKDFDGVDFAPLAEVLDAVYPTDKLEHAVPAARMAAALDTLDALYPDSELAPLLAPGNVQSANAALQNVLINRAALDNAAVFKEFQAFFEEQKDLNAIAFDMDEELRQAIRDAGNVFLAQIVEDKLKLRYTVDDILFNKPVHDEFMRRIKMTDRTDTKNQMEVDINTLITNLMTSEYERLLKGVEKKKLDGRAVLPLDEETVASIHRIIEDRKALTDLALGMNYGLGYDVPKKAPVSIKELMSTYRVLREIKPLNKHIVEFAAGYGFVKPELQKDGIIRMSAPVAEFQNRLYPHITTLLAMHYMDVPNKNVVFYPDKIVIKDAKLPWNKKPKTITIPLFEDRSLLVNWAGSFTAPDQFAHRSFKAIYEAARQYNIIRRGEYTRQYIPVKKRENLKTFALLQKSDYAMYNDILETIDQYNTLMDQYDIVTASMQGGELTEEQAAYAASLTEADINQLVEDINSLGANITEDVAAWYQETPDEQKQAIRDYMEENGPLTPEEEEAVGALTQAQIDEATGFLDEHGWDMTDEEQAILDKLSPDQEARIIAYIEQYGSITPEQQAVIDQMTPEEIKAIKDEIEFFKGKVVLTGLTAPYTHDLNPIPFDSRYPLVGMHANLVNTITKELFISGIAWPYFFMIIVGLGLVVGFVGGRSKQLPGALFMIGAIAAYGAVCVLAFNTARVWLPFVPVALSLIVVYLVVVVYRFMTEGQEAKRMKEMFSKFVTPSIVETLIQNPDMLKLGGERMDLTAMFALASGPGIHTDDAEILVDRLNEYFTAMTEEIFRFDGTLDKYEGHIIMAIYGAPVPFDDHPARACLSCVGMNNALEKLKVEWKEKGLEPINVTVGLNSGPMIAGNMGSAARFSYTIMGDSVNLSARILGAANQYGVSFMCSEMTYDRAKDKIIGRLVDDIVVVGKTEPIKVYEIVGSEQLPPPEPRKKCNEAYARGFTLYTERKWDEAIAAFDEALEHMPGDGPSKVLRARCEEYKSEPPGDDWKGEFKLTKKGV